MRGSMKNINYIAAEVFRKTSNRALDFGLELTYIIQWVLKHVRNSNAHIPICIKLLKRAMLRRTLDEEITMNRELKEPEELDDAYERELHLFELKHSLDSLTRGEYDISSLVYADRRDRFRELGKLQQLVKRRRG